MTGFEPAASWSQTRRSSQAEPHPVASALYCSRTTLDYYIKNILFCQQGFSNLFVSNIEHERERSSGRLYRSPIDRRRDHLHRKTHILPCEPKNATAFWSLSRICNVFLTKMIPAPVTYYKNSLSELLPQSNQLFSQIRIKWHEVHRINTLNKDAPHNYRFNLYQGSLFPY